MARFFWRSAANLNLKGKSFVVCCYFLLFPLKLFRLYSMALLFLSSILLFVWTICSPSQLPGSQCWLRSPIAADLYLKVYYFRPGKDVWFFEVTSWWTTSRKPFSTIMVRQNFWWKKTQYRRSCLTHQSNWTLQCVNFSWNTTEPKQIYEKNAVCDIFFPNATRGKCHNNSNTSKGYQCTPLVMIYNTRGCFDV